MAMRKPKYGHNRLYAITYRDGTRTPRINVAALSMEAAIGLFREAVGGHIIDTVERTDITTYYGLR